MKLAKVKSHKASWAGDVNGGSEPPHGHKRPRSFPAVGRTQGVGDSGRTSGNGQGDGGGGQGREIRLRPEGVRKVQREEDAHNDSEPPHGDRRSNEGGSSRQPRPEVQGGGGRRNRLFNAWTKARGTGGRVSALPPNDGQGQGGERQDGDTQDVQNASASPRGDARSHGGASSRESRPAVQQTQALGGSARTYDDGQGGRQDREIRLRPEGPRKVKMEEDIHNDSSPPLGGMRSNGGASSCEPRPEVQPEGLGGSARTSDDGQGGGGGGGEGSCDEQAEWRVTNDPALQDVIQEVGCTLDRWGWGREGREEVGEDGIKHLGEVNKLFEATLRDFSGRKTLLVRLNHNPNPQTPNPKPQTPNPKPQTLDPRP